MNAAKYGLDRVFFGGCFIRGESDLLNDSCYFELTDQVMQLQSRPYLTLSVSGQKGQCVPISSDTRDSCKCPRDRYNTSTDNTAGQLELGSKTSKVRLMRLSTRSRMDWI
jgi:hypothetical protein